MNLPYLHRPCNQCPFTTDCQKGWLKASRVKRITESNSFVCHKTTQLDKTERRQCAGHMLLLKQNNAFNRLADQLGIELALSGIERVFTSISAMIKHHANN